MEKFYLTFEFVTSYLTPLQSDTLFGEFCWRYRFLYGEEELRKLLEGPSLALSDALPEGKVPFPKLPLKLSFDSKEKYSRVKKVKKKKYLDISTFKELLPHFENGSTGEIEEIILSEVDREEEKKEKKKKKGEDSKNIESLETLHVSINRITGTAHQGKLFHLEEVFTKEGYRFAIYGLYDPKDLSLSKIRSTFEFMGLDGFGAKRSAGKGKFKVVSVEEGWGPLDGLERGQSWFVSLSTGLPEKGEVEEAYAEFFTKFPKHGREIGRGEVFKNPLILSRPGSLFKAKEKKEFYGSLVEISALSGHKHSRLVVPLFVG